MPTTREPPKVNPYYPPSGSDGGGGTPPPNTNLPITPDDQTP